MPLNMDEYPASTARNGSREPTSLAASYYSHNRSQNQRNDEGACK